jgi:uncharacterized membrane protein
MAHETRRPVPLRALKPSETVAELPLPRPSVRPLVTAGLVLGAGLGGSVDGIVLRTILQLHGMLTAWLPPTTVASVRANLLGDGLFHAFTFGVTVVGLVMLFRIGRRLDVLWSGRVLLGAILAGWGLFVLAEGLIAHFILQLHHVVEAEGLSVWDVAWLGFGVALVLCGAGLGRSAGVWPAPARRPRDRLDEY